MTGSRGFKIGLFAVFAGLFLQFAASTRAVRIATSDDVVFQRIADRPGRQEYLADLAGDQGRFLYATPVYHFALFSPFDIRSAWGFSLLRTTALFLQVGLAAVLAARLFHQPWIGPVVALGLIGLLHLPLTFYQVLSFPPAWFGFSALLGAMLCHYHSRSARGGCSVAAALLFLLAALMHDVFVVFLPAFIGLSWLQGVKRPLELLRRNLGVLTVAAGYAGVHRGFAMEFPSIYEGTQFSAALAPAVKVLVRQLVGVVPGFELLVNRLPEMTTGPLFRQPAEILATFARLHVPDFLLAGGVAAAAGAAFHRALAGPTVRAPFWLWATATAVLANLPIAFSNKYQVFILHREFPYGYAWLSYCFLGIACTGALVQLGNSLPAGRGRCGLSGALAILVFLLGLSALASNHRVLEILRERFN